MSWELIGGIGGLITLSYSGIYLYINSIGKKMDKVNDTLVKLSNGCFARHMALERELGEIHACKKSLHERVDKIEAQIDHEELDRR